MSLRELAVDIAFNTDVGKLMQVDSAVDDIKSSADDVISSADNMADSTESASSSVLKSFEKIGGATQKAGKSMSKWVTAPLVGAGTAAFKFANDQEQAFAQVSTLLDASTTDFTQYKSDMRDLSSELGVSFEDLSESVYSSISAGQDQADAIDFTRKAIMLAGGGFTTTANAVDVMTTALNAYGLESKEASNISDMLITTQNLGKTTVDELSASMGAVIPIAEAQNVAFDELAAGYAVLTKNGVNTAEAGTGMKAMLSELGKAGSKTDKILRKETGKSFSELIESGMNTGEVLGMLSETAEKSGLKLSDMFGSVQAGGAALTLTKGEGAEFQEFLEEMGNSAGATEEAFNTMADTTGDKMAIAWTTIKNTMAEFGDMLLPIVAQAATGIASIATKFTGLSPVVKTLVLVFGGLLAAIGPVLLTIGTIITKVIPMISLFTKVAGAVQKAGGMFAILSNPIGLAIAAIALIAGALVLAYNKVEWFRDAVNAAWDWVKNATSIAFDWIRGIVVDVFGAAMEFAMGIVGKFKDFWDTNSAAIMSIVQNRFNAVVSTIQMIMGIIQGIFQIAWPIITGIITVAWELIKTVISTGIDIILGIISAGMAILQGDWSGAWTIIQGIGETIWHNIESFFANINLFDIGKNILQGLIDGIGSMASAVWNKVSEVAGGITSGFKKALKIFSPSRLFKEFGVNTMMGYQIGFENQAEDAIAASESTAFDIADVFDDQPDVPDHPYTPGGDRDGYSDSYSTSSTHVTHENHMEFHFHGNHNPEETSRAVQKGIDDYFSQLNAVTE